MPDHFLFILYKEGRPAYFQAGGPIRSNLTLLPSEQGADSATPPEDALFDANSKWIYSFAEAIDVGLGGIVPLTPEDAALPQVEFSHIIAIGLRDGEPADGLAALDELITSHHYTDGFEFIPYGTPTNNTAMTESGHSDTDEKVREAFEHEIRVPVSRLRPPWHCAPGRRARHAYRNHSS